MRSLRMTMAQVVVLLALTLLTPTGALALMSDDVASGVLDSRSSGLATPIRFQTDAGLLSTMAAGGSCADGQAVIRDAVERSGQDPNEEPPGIPPPPPADPEQIAQEAARVAEMEFDWDAWVDERIAAIEARGGRISISPEAFAAVSSSCLQEAYELCRDEHEVQHVVSIVDVLDRQRQLLGIDASDPLPGSEYIPRCLSFRLEFRSEARMKVAGSGYASAVEATIELKADPDRSFVVSGSGPLKSTKLHFKLPGCTVSVRKGSSTFEVDSLGFEILDALPPPPAVPGDPDYQEEPPPPPYCPPGTPCYDPDEIPPTLPGDDQDGSGYDMPSSPVLGGLTLIFEPGRPEESITVKCPGGAPFSLPSTPYWFGAFALVHEDEYRPFGVMLTDWSIPGGELFARKTWKGKKGQVSEKGSAEIYHTPE